MKKRNYDNIKLSHKYFKKGEHDKLSGHTIFFEGQYVDDEGKIQTEKTLLTSKDLLINALKKIEYFNNKKK